MLLTAPQRRDDRLFEIIKLMGLSLAYLVWRKKERFHSTLSEKNIYRFTAKILLINILHVRLTDSGIDW